MFSIRGRFDDEVVRQRSPHHPSSSNSSSRLTILDFRDSFVTGAKLEPAFGEVAGKLLDVVGDAAVPIGPRRGVETTGIQDGTNGKSRACGARSNACRQSRRGPGTPAAMTSRPMGLRRHFVLNQSWRSSRTVIPRMIDAPIKIGRCNSRSVPAGRQIHQPGFRRRSARRRAAGRA